MGERGNRLKRAFFSCEKVTNIHKILCFSCLLDDKML